MGALARCRGCGTLVRWGVTEKKGRPIPLNPDPSPEGNLAIARTVGATLYVATPPEGWTGPRWIAHFATCPQGRSFTKPSTRRLAERVEAARRNGG